ncbi:MAG TPA: hypothetical protein VIM12_01935 [Noviherbaspirillum sp.]|jgi:hypothetical protein
MSKLIPDVDTQPDNASCSKFQDMTRPSANPGRTLPARCAKMYAPRLQAWDASRDDTHLVEIHEVDLKSHEGSVHVRAPGQ